MAKKTISNTFTVNTIIDGKNAGEVILTPSTIFFHGDEGGYVYDTEYIQVGVGMKVDGQSCAISDISVGDTPEYVLCTLSGTTITFYNTGADYGYIEGSVSIVVTGTITSEGVTTTYIATGVLSIVCTHAGETAENAFVVDLENEMTNVALDENGVLISDFDMYFKVRAYYGTTNVLSECSVSASCSDSNVTLTTTAAKTTGIRVQVAQNLPLANSTDITVTVTHPTYGTRIVVFTLAGVRGGANAVLQELLPSLDTISFARQSDGSLTPASKNLGLSIKKTQGSQTIIQTISQSGLTIRWSLSVMPTQSSSGSAWGQGTATGVTWSGNTMQIANGISEEHVCIAAFNSAGTLVDRETIPIVKDGQNGDDAKYIYIRGTGYNNDAERILNITSTANVFSTYEYGRNRGFVAARINRGTLAVSGITWFDVYGGLSEGEESDANADAARTRFVTYLTNTTSDYFLAVASQDAIGLNDAMVVKLREFGLGKLDYTAVSGVDGFRTPFAFLGYKGLQQGYALCQLHGDGENEPYAEVMAYVSNGIFMSSKDGVDGARGKIGRFFYFGGTFDSSDTDPTHTFVVNDAQAPYFEHTETVTTQSGTTTIKRYHVFNYDTNGSYTMAQMWAISNDWNNEPWEVMTNDFKYIITEALFGAYAKLGSFVINGDWMISQHGVIYDTNGGIHTIDANHSYGDYNVNNAYTLFDVDYPNSSKPNANNFVPNFAVDGLTGKTYQNDAYIRGTIYSQNGTIGGFEIGENEIGGISEISGGFQGTKIYSDGRALIGNVDYNYGLRTTGGVEMIGNGKNIVINTTTGSYTNHGFLLINGYIKLVGIPRSTIGLQSGEIYVDSSGNVKMVL